MAKKKTEEKVEVKKVEVKVEKVEKKPEFDESIPEKKQRHLR